jgi:hypothetical protein
MTGFSILFAVAALVAAIVMGVRVRRQGTALGAAADRIAQLQTDLDEMRTERAQQTLRADTAEAAHDEAITRATALDAELQVAVSTIAEAIRTRDDAHRAVEALQAAQLGSVDADALWALELARLDRRWHMSVAPGIGFTSPLAECAPGDAPRVALDIVASALREETGTRYVIDWQATAELPVATALLVVRAGDELLSAAALASEVVRLRVAEAPEHVVLTVEAFDDAEQPVALAPIAAGKVAAVGPSSAEVVDGATVRVSRPPTAA